MIILLSPAKKMNLAPAPAELPQSMPALSMDITALSEVTSGLTRLDLTFIMGISDKLADLNYQRFQSFSATRKNEARKQALLCFSGDVYQGLDAKSLAAEDLDFAQAHLRILSGLYGILRPMDLILPYRLEMGTRLKTPRGNSLYEFWGDKIARALERDLKDHPSPYLVNLASAEYFKAANHKSLKTQVITPVFKEEKDGMMRVIGLFAKKARGVMARYAIDNRIEDPNGLKKFRSGGYRFSRALSSENEWVFTRRQPVRKGN